jgi:hypothetical protein
MRRRIHALQRGLYGNFLQALTSYEEEDTYTTEGTLWQLLTGFDPVLVDSCQELVFCWRPRDERCIEDDGMRAVCVRAHSI